MGGACAAPGSTPTPPTPEPLGGGTVSGYRHKVARGSVYVATKPPTLKSFRVHTGVAGRIAATIRKPTVSVTAMVGVAVRVIGATKPPMLSIVSRQYDFSEDEILAVVAAVSMMKDRDAPSS